MRVLLATDGSTSARIAADLVVGARWPAGTTVEVVAVADTAALLPSAFATLPADAQPLEDALLAELRASLTATMEQLSAAGLEATTTLLTGHPVDRLAERARASHADLIVCGSRGHGGFRALLLGSVSAGLAERAPCPVLVARGDRIDRVLLADDGSDPALAAEAVVAGWPMFEGVPLDILAVACVHPVWRSAMSMLTLGPSITWTDTAVRDVRDDVEHHLDAAVRRLALAGRVGRGVVREGDPAAVIVEQAEATASDLVVLGTHGRTGLDRLMLGSVARAVLLHAKASVLVVRPAAVAAPVEEEPRHAVGAA